MDKCFSDTDLTLKKIHIPESLFPTFYYNLSRVGVSASTLFPGLYGIVERIRYENINREDEKPSR